MTSPMTISIDRKDVAPEDAKISILDHGFLFGDSVYEVVRTYKGKLLFCQEHLDRLDRSAEGIGLPMPLSHAEFRAEFERMHARSGNKESYIRLIVTRGVGELDLATGSCHQQTSIVIVKPLKVWDEKLYEHGGKLHLTTVQRNSPRATNPAFKTGNYLNNVLAVDQARAAEATEAVMLSVDGYVAECTTSNIFLVKEGVVHTPALAVGILSGVTRAKVIEICGKRGLECREGELTKDDLFGADEVFITSTTRDVMPISRIDDDAIADGKLGEITRTLMQAFHNFCEQSIANA